MIKKENLIIAGLIVLILFLFGYLYWQEPKKEIVYVDSEQADTMIKFVMQYPKPITIQGKAKIIYREIEIPVHHTILDTVFGTKPFTASLDTIVKDTFSIRFDYPENIFSFVLRPAPDSVEVITIVITKSIEKPEAWYIKPLYVTGSLLIGYGLGSIK